MLHLGWNKIGFTFLGLTQRARQKQIRRQRLWDSQQIGTILTSFYSPPCWGNWSHNIGEDRVQSAFISPELLRKKNLSLLFHIITGASRSGLLGKGKVSREMSMQHMQARASRCDMSASTTLNDEVGMFWSGGGWWTGSHREWGSHSRREREK